jgi:hypothetical protein
VGLRVRGEGKDFEERKKNDCEAEKQEGRTGSGGEDVVFTLERNGVRG